MRLGSNIWDNHNHISHYQYKYKEITPSYNSTDFSMHQIMLIITSNLESANKIMSKRMVHPSYILLITLFSNSCFWFIGEWFMKFTQNVWHWKMEKHYWETYELLTRWHYRFGWQKTMNISACINEALYFSADTVEEFGVNVVYVTCKQGNPNRLTHCFICGTVCRVFRLM